MAAVRQVLRESCVAKRGKKGRTDFYRDPTGEVRNRKFKARDGGAPMLEVLAGGSQTVIPPTIHPETGEPYIWTGTRTLYDTPVDNLPVITAAQIAALGEALSPWLAERSKRAKRGSTAGAVSSGADRNRQAAYVKTAIEKCSSELAATAEGGRNNALFAAACKLGRWVHHGVIAPDALTGRLLAACETNGLIGHVGREAVLASIQSGLDASQNDPLPELLDRPVSDRRAEPLSVSSITPSTLISQDTIALRLVEQADGRLLFCHHRGDWFYWTDARWQRDETSLAFHFARNISRAQSNILGDPDERKAIQRAAFASGVEKFARADPKVAVTSAAFDRDPFLLGTPNGTVDLRTGQLRAPDLSDRITRVTAVVPTPDADCPQFLAFLGEATGGDGDLIRFLRQVCGYCLTGAIREHVLLFIYGDGGTGKSTFLKVLTGILSDYATVASMEVFTASQFDRHPTELARMQGARLVTAIETERGRAWAESRIKSLTGGDPISARFMRQDFFTFLPQFKLLCVGNDAPNLHGVDQAMRRRFRIIPFTVKPDVANPHLAEQLQAEWPAILRWMIEGCLDWQVNGLIEPTRVKAEGEAYFSQQDVVGQWAEARCETGAGMSEATGELFASWASWTGANGERAGSSKNFSQMLIRAGFAPLKNTPGHHGKRGFGGIQLRRQSNGG